MLDTDTVSYAIRGQGQVVEKLKRMRPSQIAVSTITVAELRYGLALKKSDKLTRLVNGFLMPIERIAFDELAALRFGAVAADLRHAGRSIGELDALIASHALAVGRVLVTNNLRHFTRIKGLKVESWV